MSLHCYLECSPMSPNCSSFVPQNVHLFSFILSRMYCLLIPVDILEVCYLYLALQGQSCYIRFKDTKLILVLSNNNSDNRSKRCILVLIQKLQRHFTK